MSGQIISSEAEIEMSELTVPGPTGRLDALYTQADDPRAPAALILAPDPRFGGTMNNKVVIALHKSFQNCGFTVLRINYRRTSGDLPPSEDKSETAEISDATVAINHLQYLRPHASASWVAGYSYGSWVALQVIMRRPEMSGFVAVSPPVNLYDYTFLSPCPASGLIVTGRADKTVPKIESKELIDRLTAQPNTEIIHRIVPRANHFYDCGVEDLIKTISRYLNKVLR